MTKISQTLYRLLLLVILPLCVIPHMRAQNEQWYTSDGYLSSSLIGTVLYDTRGMLWIATEDCLNRFDGSKFTIYRNNPADPHSIGNDRVNNIVEDRDGRILVCSHAGVQIYDPAADAFSEPLRVGTEGAPSSPLSDIVQRRDGELWAVGNNIYRIVDIDGHSRLEPVTLPEDLRFIYRAAVDPDDNIWLARHTDGLYCVTPQGQVRHYFGGQDDPVMTSFATGADGQFYAGTVRHGLYRYDAAADNFSHVDLRDDNPDLSVMAIYPDEFGNLLIGTDGDGLKVYKTENGHNWQFSFSNINSGKLKVHGIAKDPTGNLWVGVYQKGLLKVPKTTGFFRSIDQRRTDIIGTCCVTALVRDGDGRLWVGTDNDNLYAVAPSGYWSQHYTDKMPKTIMSLYEDSKGRLWVGSYNHGMGIVDRRTGAYTPMRLTHNGIDVSNVYGFAEMPDGDMLIATMGAGLMRYNPSTQTGERIEGGNLGAWTTCVDLSQIDGGALVGTYDGFFMLSPDLTSVQHLLPGQIVSAIHQEPRHGNIWVGTNAGLVCLNYDGDIIATYTTADGLPSLGINAIERGDDALWISTNKGLTKFKVKEGEFVNFNVDHGLPHNEFSRNASYKDADGNIYFGGINGIASLRSADIDVPAEKLTLRVTDFMIGDSSINATTLSGGRHIIDVPLTEATHFNLSCHDNSFSVVINSKEFVSTVQTEYYYSFDGSEWTPIHNRAHNMGGVTLTFTNVGSGSHKLLVKAVNAGLESDELALTIDIDTVWYATWWARLIYALLIGVLLYLVYRQVRHRIAEREQAELRRHKGEILESKLQFFTNISHEIRTPLSLVIGPLQKLHETEQDPTRSNTYRVVLRNANRILRLVNELMDLRKIDNKQMRLRMTPVNIVGFVNDLYETFRPAAEAKHIRFEYDHGDIDDLVAWVDVSNFDKVVMNLLSNAVKFTPDHGTITLSLSRGTDPSCSGPLHDYVEISVTDSGIGISPDDRKSIFNRFYQASNNNVGGTGIGLHLTRELVSLHHGEIFIEDTPSGQGTRFVVRIPAGDCHLTPEEICTEPDSMLPVVTEPALQEQLPVDLDIAPETAEPVKAPRGNDTVYVVEDDEEILNYLVSNLSAYFRTLGFRNGKLALEQIHTAPPSLVITDVMMPDMDGYTLTRKIKQNINLNHIPVIVLTARTREEDNIEAIDSGADVYMTKPFNVDVLIKTALHQMKSVARLRNAFSGQQHQEDKLDNIDVVSNDDKLMARVMRVINKNLSNSDITVEMIAREIGISRVHLHRKLKELTNQSTRDFIRNIRLQAAAKLLREKKLAVSEVSDLVGFKQANNFSTAFKEMFGMSPTAYSAKYHGEQSDEA